MSSPPVIQNMSKPRRASMNRSRGGETGAGGACTLREEAVTRLWLACCRPRPGVAADIVAALQGPGFERSLDRAREGVGGDGEVEGVVLERALHGNLCAVGRLQDAAHGR